MDARELDELLERIRKEEQGFALTVYLNAERARELFTDRVSDTQQLARALSTSGSVAARFVVSAEGSRSQEMTGTTVIEPHRMAALLEWVSDEAGRVEDVPGGDFRRRDVLIRDVDRRGESRLLVGDFESSPGIPDRALTVIRRERERMEQVRARRARDPQPPLLGWVHVAAKRTFAAMLSQTWVEWGTVERLVPGMPLTFLGLYEREDEPVVFLRPIWIRRLY
jgi:hypothetical protein